NRPPERPRPGGLTSPSLQPYCRYLEARWQDGCSNIAQLHREVEALGYQGSRSLLYRVLVPWRGPRPPPDPATGRRRPRRAPPATMGAGSPSARRINLISMSATHYMRCWITMSASPPDTSCFNGLGVLSFESVHAISASGSRTRKLADFVRS